MLTGGAGLDVFQFSTGHTSADRSIADLITDFSRIEGDRINVRAIDANTLVAGNQNFAFIGDAGFSDQAGQLRYEKVAGENATYVEGDVNGDSIADFSIRVAGLIDFLASDFVL